MQELSLRACGYPLNVILSAAKYAMEEKTDMRMMGFFVSLRMTEQVANADYV